MKREFYKILSLTFLTLLTIHLHAGNPDRQGEAGAYELLINPWARGSALNTLNASRVKGTEAMMVNPAGLGRISKRQEILAAHTRWLVPSGITVNSFGYTTKKGENGALSFSLMSLDMGNIKVTTTESPEGTGATYKPTFFNLGVGYSYTFGGKVSVGSAVRVISETISDLSAFGFCIDGGVQYAAGDENQFKLGIALRNIGSPMRFSGSGLSTQLQGPAGHQLTYDVRLSRFELPSLLHLGMSYDFKVGDYITTTPMANFTANSFGKDLLGVGLETEINKMFSLRFSYSGPLGSSDVETKGAYLGFGMGFGLEYPLDKKGNNILMLDYGYRPTNPFQGTHNIGIGLSF
ncbi:MAG: PorV/PorQ family protein [Saprospiraceae bacterium]|nr:PorV/PorQ family protein [Saprospiraceae bacterium]